MVIITDQEIEDVRNGVPSCHWRVSPTPPTISPMETYRGVECYFTLSIVHGGRFTETPNRQYLTPINHYAEYININNFNVDMLRSIITSLGYASMGFCYYWVPDHLLDYGLKRLQNNRDIDKFKEVIREEEFRNVKRIFVEHTEIPSVTVFWPDTLVNADADTIESILYPVVSDNYHMSVTEAKAYVRYKYKVSVPKNIIEAGLKQAKRTHATAWWNVV